MSYYRECDPHMDNQFVQLYKNYRKKKLKQNKSTLEDLLFGDNIIAQLVSFGSNLLTEGLTLAKSLKEHTLDKLKKKDELTEE